VWLLLCSSDDRPALWMADRLRARGLSPLVVLTPELLHFSFEWRHRLDSEHPPSVEFTLADGRSIHSEEIKGVVNRLTGLPPHLVAHLIPADRTYALQEWTALHISWLSALRAPVLNRPVMQGLSGAWRHESEWRWLAHRTGLGTAPFRQVTTRPNGRSSDTAPRPFPARTLFVVDGHVIGDGTNEETASACTNLARLADTRLLGIDLDAVTGEFVGASPAPDLRLGGEPLVAVLQKVLVGHA
jgi:hypothetical protein